jgi:hypothetical protein
MTNRLLDANVDANHWRGAPNLNNATILLDSFAQQELAPTQQAANLPAKSQLPI